MGDYLTYDWVYRGRPVCVHSSWQIDQTSMAYAFERNHMSALSFKSEITDLVLDNDGLIVKKRELVYYYDDEPPYVEWTDYEYGVDYCRPVKIVQLNADCNDWTCVRYTCYIGGSHHNCYIDRGNDSIGGIAIRPGVWHGPYHPMPPQSTDRAAQDFFNRCFA